MSILGLIVVLVVLGFIFNRGPSTGYFWPGSVVGTIVFVLLLLWIFGVIGGHTHYSW